MKRLLERLSQHEHLCFYVSVVAFLVSFVFSFVIFPKIMKPHDLVLDPDFYGKLGFGLWKKHIFAFYPETDPTVARGPAYPMLVALLLMLTRGWYPGSVQLAQCVVFAATCGLVFWISERLWNRSVALVASVVFAVHPSLVWFTSRIWVEVLTTFLFVALIAASVAFSSKPTPWKGVLIGGIIGIGALTKSTLLPLVILMPLLMRWAIGNRLKARVMLIMLLTASAVISPWTVRNWKVAGRFIPVHVMAGVNCFYGDCMVDGFSLSKLSLDETFDASQGELDKLAAASRKAPTRHDREILQDSIATKISMDRYKKNPAFIFKKMAMQALYFWTLGGSRTKSLIISLMQIPLLVAFLVSLVVLTRRRQMRRIMSVHVALMALYFALHLPFHTQNRYSVVVIPMMIVFVVAALLRPTPSDAGKG